MKIGKGLLLVATLGFFTTQAQAHMFSGLTAGHCGTTTLAEARIAELMEKNSAFEKVMIRHHSAAEAKAALRAADSACFEAIQKNVCKKEKNKGAQIMRFC